MHEDAAPGFGFEFDGIRAIEPRGVPAVSATGGHGRALTDSGGGPGGGAHSGSSGVMLRENTERPEIRWKWGRCTGRSQCH